MKKTLSVLLCAAFLAAAAPSYAYHASPEEEAAAQLLILKGLVGTAQVLNAILSPFAADIKAAADAADAGGSSLLKFRYHADTGLCLDAKGKRGLNATALEKVAETKNGECADLHGLTLNGDNLAYPRLKGWNLRGADLKGSGVFFAHLDDADLAGADMTGFRFGYASLRGTVDKFTKNAPCLKAGTNSISCVR